MKNMTEMRILKLLLPTTGNMKEEEQWKQNFKNLFSFFFKKKSMIKNIFWTKFMKDRQKLLYFKSSVDCVWWRSFHSFSMFHMCVPSLVESLRILAFVMDSVNWTPHRAAMKNSRRETRVLCMFRKFYYHDSCFQAFPKLHLTSIFKTDIFCFDLAPMHWIWLKICMILRNHNTYICTYFSN